MATALEPRPSTAPESEAALGLVVPLPCAGLTVTPEAFATFCTVNPGWRLTREATGEVTVMSPAGTKTGMRNARLTGRLLHWAESNGLGFAFDSSAGFTLPNGFVHAPDASWLAAERWNALSEQDQTRFAPVCPDFVVELLSPSDRRVEAHRKLLEFMSQGARLGWLIDPEKMEVEIHRAGREMEVLQRPTTLSGEDVLPGFLLDLKGVLFD